MYADYSQKMIVQQEDLWDVLRYIHVSCITIEISKNDGEINSRVPGF